MTRLIEAALAAAGLLLLSPLFAAIAAAILIETGRPVLFRQVRVGRNGRLFELVKFRSMLIGREGAGITAASDHRITRLGGFLRKYKLDELPQLWNVLKGEMSVVGPRPEVPQFVDTADPAWRAVLAVAPGITDPASLIYRDEEKILGAVDAANVEEFYRRAVLPEKLALNLAYLRERTLRSDIKVIALTALYSLFPRLFDQGAARRRLIRTEVPN